MTRSGLCGKDVASEDKYESRCYCKPNTTLCLVGGDKSSGKVYKNGKPVCFKCSDEGSGDKVSAEQDCVKILVKCNSVQEEAKAKVFEQFACNKLGFESVKNQEKKFR